MESPHFLDFIYRSEGFPLTGLFHPWAQWDLGLDTLENSSRRAAAVAAVALWLVGWLVGEPTPLAQGG